MGGIILFGVTQNKLATLISDFRLNKIQRLVCTIDNVNDSIEHSVNDKPVIESLGSWIIE